MKNKMPNTETILTEIADKVILKFKDKMQTKSRYFYEKNLNMIFHEIADSSLMVRFKEHIEHMKL